MRRLVAFLVTGVVLAALVPQAFAEEPPSSFRAGTVYVDVSENEVVAGNDLVERSWARAGWATTTFIDKRSPGGIEGTEGPDFTLDIGPTGIDSDAFTATNVAIHEIPGGLRAEVSLALEGLEPALTATRVIEIYEGIAGMRTQTIINSTSGLVLRGYTLEQAAVGSEVAATLHAFRAGADWREPDWTGPELSIGDPHPGTWRDTRVAEAGEDISGAAQWASVARGGHSLFMVMERNDWPSSRAAYVGGSARLQVDYSADVVIIGPFEESGHAENPAAGDAPARHRVLKPGTTYAMEPVFVGFGANPDDEPWQFYKYLSEHRAQPYDHEVTFNSNGTDANLRSTGAKDDMVEEVVAETAPIAKRLGIETFILDDGWQARSGDWFPDCRNTETGEQHTDPRWDGTEASKFRPRFTDCAFERVRELVAPMELGLWMNVMHFHPRSDTYTSHPEWGCKPTGDATGATSILDPDSGSNDAGIGTWSAQPELIDHIEARIQNAITNWGVTYFKFDFLVWLDCAGQNDMYEYKEAFMAMLDRLITSYPDVTFETDETNDYRLFPFESVARGPSWFQNGSPPPHRLLHNLWNLSPFVPAYSLGQHFLGGNQFTQYPVDTLMAAALPSHMTFFSELRNIPADVIDRARPWIDFYTANRDHFSQMTYPLLQDPLELNWTALQNWNPELRLGALLAFRQQADNETENIALRNIPPDMTFDLIEAPTGTKVGTATSDELTDGIDITVPAKDGAHVLLIKPTQAPELDRTTRLTYDGPTQIKVGRRLTLAATLTGSDGPIAGVPLSFNYRGRTYAPTTGADIAVVPVWRQKVPLGTYEVHVSYAGSDHYLRQKPRLRSTSPANNSVPLVPNLEG